MRSITRLFGAFGALADSILALASVVDVATGKLRQQLALETDPPALAHSGEVIDGTTADNNIPLTKRNNARAKATA